ncbi:type 1 glutamine amidotransferase family protein [Terribacillus saccharophilus]|jgi:putative intracellular protease/amidase|uniref:Glutamine amidotransferase n=1 Tax=Terribacillus saccharophilus TaxID=361277 RepID=A0ABX4GYG9_9BACI|nr:type 1 glutamine amidotransferase family protein [Terribacillus saccharophilus]PAD35798.1 glutamine amidotransferase [Terribacillus saccharophilus]PAD96331.1 glutamine amidotransferase [Terribacillus saccharophilus]PAD99906.1 glutamine amidotransferase [Terribacillus saccharophilus]
MKKTVLIFLTDQYADWEVSYVAAELQAPHSEYQVKTVTLDGKPVSSIGGFKVLPDYSLAETKTIDFHMLILPGGNTWRQPETVPVKELVAHCVANNIPVAAICDATVFLGRYGFLEGRKHTSNTLEYLKEGAPIYTGEEDYIDAQSVRDGNLITANGTAPLEFAQDILKLLAVQEDEKIDRWYRFFKEGSIVSSR